MCFIKMMLAQNKGESMFICPHCGCEEGNSENCPECKHQFGLMGIQLTVILGEK